MSNLKVVNDANQNIAKSAKGFLVALSVLNEHYGWVYTGESDKPAEFIPSDNGFVYSRGVAYEAKKDGCLIKASVALHLNKDQNEMNAQVVLDIDGKETKTAIPLLYGSGTRIVNLANTSLICAIAGHEVISFNEASYGNGLYSLFNHDVLYRYTRAKENRYINNISIDSIDDAVPDKTVINLNYNLVGVDKGVKTIQIPVDDYCAELLN